MSDLDRLLRQADHVPAPDLWPDIRARRHRSQEPTRARRLLIAAVALPLAASGVAVAALAFFGEPSVPPAAPGSEPKLRARVAEHVPVGPFPAAVAAGEGVVWVAVNDPRRGERWFLARIDPSTNTVAAEVDVFEASEVAVGEDAVWASGRDRRAGQVLSGLDLRTGEVIARIPLGCSRCHLDQIVAGPDAIWMTVANVDEPTGEVVKVDPSTNLIVARIAVEGDPRDLAVGEGGVWVYALTHFSGGAVFGGTIYRIDAATGRLAAELLPGEVPPNAGIHTPPVLAAGHGYVWTSRYVGDDVEIVRIDPRTNAVLGTGIRGTAFYPFSTEAGRVWFRSGHEDAEPVIAELDPRTLEAQDLVPLDSTIVDATLDAETMTIWVADYEQRVTRIDLLPTS
jgi:hypothetical protein